MADCLAGVEALADALDGAGRDERAYCCSSGRGSTAPVRDDVLVEVEDGAVHHASSRRGSSRTARDRLAGLTIPRPGELPQPRLPPGAARAHPARARDVLDLARADVRRRRAARPRTPTSTLARATYREMVAAGITAVGEFHYLHHQPDGTPYDDPNAMGHALRRGGPRGRDPDRAARHLLPRRRLRRSRPRACRCASATATPTAWADAGRRRSTADRAGRRRRRRGRSTRCARCPRDQMRHGRRRADRTRRPLHVHLSEQVAENDACLAAYGVTPDRRLLAEAGALGPADHAPCTPPT